MDHGSHPPRCHHRMLEDYDITIWRIECHGVEAEAFYNPYNRPSAMKVDMYGCLFLVSFCPKYDIRLGALLGHLDRLRIRRFRFWVFAVPCGQ